MGWPILPEQAQSENPKGFGEQSSPISVNQENKQ
jgi:hypothetical protein